MKQIERVLVIDDDETSIFLTKRLLHSVGVGSQIQTALNGLEGLNSIKKAVAEELLPQLILLDIKMPVMDGFAFLEELERLPNMDFNDTKIALLSSSHNPWEMEKAKKYPVSAFLHKPLTKEKLQRVLEHA
ncbi:response regulator [Pontibacter diazotrophicus]|uniref:Response regulator n=1 Tax=Pontibacter diazotrophicus TaxID=1400979 RepID=A0A3D8LC87_9BACT|nr:response regulator [Pontibacter diazotrophicus]RDV15010.1 response regulator [Pontibacter diazotrophicus]